MKLRKLSEEVFVAEDAIVRFGQAELDLIRRQAAVSPRKRARICAHRDNADTVHEMFISISADSYIHPHKHLGKGESFHIVQGQVDVVIFDDHGGLLDVVELGEIGSGKNIFYRLSHSFFHTLLIRSDILVVHEVTNGPFDPELTVLAPFAPSENEPERAGAYMRSVAERVMERHRSQPDEIFTESSMTHGLILTWWPPGV